MFGGWRTSFTIGYGLPLKDFLLQSDGKRFLDFSFGCPIDDLVIDNLIVKVTTLHYFVIYICVCVCIESPHLVKFRPVIVTHGTAKKSWTEQYVCVIYTCLCACMYV